MLIDTVFTVAYKCPSCGSFEFDNGSLFHVSEIGILTCSCGENGVAITADDDGTIRLSIPCIGCGDTHLYTVCARSLTRREPVIVRCPVTSVACCVLGKPHRVEAIVDQMEKENDEMLNGFGYESYFQNSQVMLDSINRIHEIAEKGNLSCECGSSEADLLPMQDRIYLRCRKCSAGHVIFAASNEDLRKIRSSSRILLPGHLENVDLRKI